MLQSPYASPSCSEPTARNGLSLTPNGCSLPSHHWEIKAPGLLLHCPAKPGPQPVRSATPSPQLGLPQPWRSLRYRPVVQFPTLRSRLVVWPPLPFGVLTPLWLEVYLDSKLSLRLFILSFVLISFPFIYSSFHCIFYFTLCFIFKSFSGFIKPCR
jgi:hypothetical protein